MGTPRRPHDDGSNEAQFAIAVFDAIWGSGKLVAGPGMLISKTANGVVLIPQIPTVIAPSGNLNYRGEFDKTKPNKVGDIVRVSSIPIAPTPLDIANQVTGWFICVQDTVIFNAAKGYYSIPQYPEPVTSAGDNSSATVGTCYWHTWNLGIQVVVMADDIKGTVNMMVNGSPSYVTLPRVT